MKKMVNEFKKFISKGSIIDLSIAVIIGSAFGKIVTSFTKDIIMPIISLFTGNQGFENYKYVITAADEVNGIAENAIYYGQFIQNVIDFLIIAVVIFLMIKMINKANELSNKLKEEAIELQEEIAQEVVGKVPKIEDILGDIKGLLQQTLKKKDE